MDEKGYYCVVCGRFLPSDGIPANEAMSQIIALVDPLPAPVQEPDRVRECAKRLVEHADFKLGGALSADSKAKDIPSNAISNVKARHLAALRDALEATPPAQPAAWVWLKDDELIAAYRRGRDSVPKPTNGWCFVDDHIPGLREVQREVLYTLREKNGGAA